ncbi:hypothetical protein ESCO_003196 [Escovopsis weberi]|uniref:Uncharacterized protein n=1 Tax=Escovopsis weberi TaxID=150374 RepID=A0A0M9VSL4_ESCWE|nr:hypothetical protein ESCO_003196 [Escovopsis weberi]
MDVDDDDDDDVLIALVLAASQRMGQTPFPGAAASATQVDIAFAATLFGLVQGRPPSTRAPLGNYLARVPERPSVPTGGPELICTERPAARHGLGCGNMVARDCQCVLPHHGPKPVCNACAAEGNARFARAGAWRLDDVLRCRAYLCNDCAEDVSSQPAALDRLRMAGVRDVRGRPYMDPNISGPQSMANGVIHFRGPALPVTGCSCALKLLAQRMCLGHKVRIVQEMAKRADLIRDWRIREFGRPVCPACILHKPATQANLSADAAGQLDAVGPRAWACLLCCEWVVNQDVRPKVVDGYRNWFPQPPQDWVNS